MKAVLAIVLVLSIAAISGCVGSAPAIDETGAKDCVGDLDCLQAAWNACEKAKIRRTENLDGMVLEMYGLVMGGTTESCKIYVKVENIIMPANASIEQKLGAEALIKGKDMTCTAAVTGESTPIDFNDLSKCSGSLVDSINTIKSMTGQ